MQGLNPSLQSINGYEAEIDEKNHIVIENNTPRYTPTDKLY